MLLISRFFLCCALIGIANFAHAISECAGLTYSGKIVKVTVFTAGAMGIPDRGKVEVRSATGSVRSYNLSRSDIVQFYESDSGNRAIVGLKAYKNTTYPVMIRYVGPNYYPNDLARVLKRPSRPRVPGNEMRIWGGPGYPADRGFVFRDVVCSVAIDA